MRQLFHPDRQPVIRVGILHSADRPVHHINKDGTFTLHDVCIGIHFHWQRHENQTFKGQLKFVNDDTGVWAVNELPLEDYLTSVISSEMSAEASLEFLKAHAVIARSWVLAAPKDHTLFDVCADDHCQRYQGLHRITNENAVRAVQETAGQVLTYNGKICDTRYSKCCGGHTELFSTCWDDVDVPYLQSFPCPYCNTHDPHILRQVLNGYDQETTDFYQWSVSYTQEQLSRLISQNLNTDFGQVLDLVPLKRGPSGRISWLRIVGSRATREIGKELTIRRALSSSHLYSSAFQVEVSNPSENDSGGKVFTLHGRGWGHGVGLCQIGAAVMGERGYDYKQILQHYYSGTTIQHYDEN